MVKCIFLWNKNFFCMFFDKPLKMGNFTSLLYYKSYYHLKPIRNHNSTYYKGRGLLVYDNAEENGVNCKTNHQTDWLPGCMYRIVCKMWILLNLKDHKHVNRLMFLITAFIWHLSDVDRRFYFVLASTGTTNVSTCTY